MIVAYQFMLILFDKLFLIRLDFFIVRNIVGIMSNIFSLINDFIIKVNRLYFYSFISNDLVIFIEF
jgi:hypothetical protein